MGRPGSFVYMCLSISRTPALLSDMVAHSTQDTGPPWKEEPKVIPIFVSCDVMDDGSADVDVACSVNYQAWPFRCCNLYHTETRIFSGNNEQRFHCKHCNKCSPITCRASYLYGNRRSTTSSFERAGGALRIIDYHSLIPPALKPPSLLLTSENFWLPRVLACECYMFGRRTN